MSAMVEELVSACFDELQMGQRFAFLSQAKPSAIRFSARGCCTTRVWKGIISSARSAS